MRYFICSNTTKTSKNIEKTIINKLNNRNFIFDEEKPEIVISVGGDGTMLKAIHKYENNLNSIGFVGISLERSLGFLCDFTYEEVEKLIDLIIENKPRYEANKLLEVTYKDKVNYFVNEVRLESKFNTLKLKLHINGEHFEDFRSNGFNVATPFGSTGYNKSLGGPLVHPRLPSLIFGKIANINNRIVHSLSFFLLLRHYDIIEVEGNFNDCILGGDNTYEEIKLDEVNKIRITTSQNAVIFLRYGKCDYYDRVKRSL